MTTREISGAPVTPLPSGRRPARAVLEGARVRLEPVDPPLHAAELFAAAEGHDALWSYLGYGPFESAAVLQTWLGDCAAAADPIFFVLRDLASGKAAGMASFLNIVPKNGTVEIGHIWFAPVLQRTAQASEAIFVMLRHAFDDLGYRRVEWKCDALNEPSRRAALRFGFSFEGIFYQHMIVKGRNRDTAWYAMLDGDWPRLRESFETWLAPENFDAEGRQKSSLSTLNKNQ